MGKVKANAFSINLGKGGFFPASENFECVLLSFLSPPFHCQISISLKHCFKMLVKSLISGCISALNTHKELQNFFNTNYFSN